jgi:hypothetical protein
MMKLVKSPHLDDFAPRFLEVGHFFPQCQRKLEGSHAARDIIACEGPVEHGHRACQHAFDREGSQALGNEKFPHCHGLGAGYVTVNNRRTDVPRSVGLNPGVLREGKAFEKVPEILHPARISFLRSANCRTKCFGLLRICSLRFVKGQTTGWCSASVGKRSISIRDVIELHREMDDINMHDRIVSEKA